MKSFRLFLSIFTVLVLGLGFFASQEAALSGDATGWATWVDTKWVASSALFLLAVGIVLSLVRDQQEPN